MEARKMLAMTDEEQLDLVYAYWRGIERRVTDDFQFLRFVAGQIDEDDLEPRTVLKHLVQLATRILESPA